VPIAPPTEGSEVAFWPGGSEPSESTLVTWLSAAERLRGEPVEWRIDVRVSRAEIDRASIDRDPGALFDLIEGRGEELVRRLEEVGVPSERIRLQAPPPWGYEDHLDDDPGFLERYWIERLAKAPVARIETRWDAALDRVAADRSGEAMLVTGAGGQAFVRAHRSAPLRRAAAPGRLPPLALGRLRDAWVAVGRQGALWEADVAFEADLVEGSEALVWRAGTVAGGVAFFDALRAVAVSPSGRPALVVGDGGRMLWREAGAPGWRVLLPSDSRARAAGPMIR
jgi:hypothetical protein